MWTSVKFFIASALLINSSVLAYNIKGSRTNSCPLSNSLINEINSYKRQVGSIIYMATNGSYKGVTWKDLAYFVDTFGPRHTGTQALEDSIDYVLNKSISFGFDNVYGDVVKVPVWVRGKESATLLTPRKKNIKLVGSGFSIGTPPEGITADVIVVNDFAELYARSAEVPGKIVVYNQEFVSYIDTVIYRDLGPSIAAKLGAVAALTRSITPFSFATPHAGLLDYAFNSTLNVTKIPGASITAEDSTLFRRLQERGKRLRINLKMGAKNLGETTSRNVIAEIRGSEYPEKVVVISGHIDSWDNTDGPLDDGGGAFIAWTALKLLKTLNYRPRRTIRMIMWTAEEMGIVGANQYIERFKNNERNLQFVMESDVGTFEPLGLKFNGTKEVECVLENVMRLLTPLGEMKLDGPAECPDIDAWIESGIPGASLWNANDRYFWYSHTEADSMLVEDPVALDKNTALFAAVAFVLADLSVDLPHTQIKKNQ
ncbi:carboxypeptidase Q-like [Prorops nasuta]|uniref:carboxypeptidase Q-like n=1 Tax=Prorops nasuta TaxID=863751 RepID=UPI0034CFEA33